MCNLYSITKGPQAIRDFVRAVRNDVGNMHGPAVAWVFAWFAGEGGRTAQRELILRKLC
jgi:hypothetical protein